MNRRHLQLLFLLNPLATFRFGLKLRSFKMLVMRRSRVIVRGSMDLGGLLVLGNTWGHPPFKRTQLTMAKGGWFHTKGNVKIFEGSEIRITKTGKLTINSGFLNECCTIECFHEITIGHNANIARNVIIRDSDGHHLSDRLGNSGVIAIGDNVWIGMNSIILKNVRIGDGAVVAAGSVVNRDVGAGTLVAGVPARFVRNVTWS